MNCKANLYLNLTVNVVLVYLNNSRKSHFCSSSSFATFKMNGCIAFVCYKSAVYCILGNSMLHTV